MRKTIFATVALSLAFLAAQDAFAQEFTAFVPGGSIVREAKIYTVPNTGALQASAREGNVLQAVNPLAPASFGSGEKYVAYESRDPFIRSSTGGPIAFGLRLFVIEF